MQDRSISQLADLLTAFMQRCPAQAESDNCVRESSFASDSGSEGSLSFKGGYARKSS